MRYSLAMLASVLFQIHAWALAPASAQDVAQGVSKEEIVVGAFGPLTGPASWLGLGARSGLTLGINEINANGGVNGRKIKLIYEPAQTAAESIAAAKKLVEQEKVAVLLLAGGSLGAAAAADYVRGVGVPAYSIISGTKAIHEPFARNVFQGVSPSSDKLAEYTLQALLRGAKSKPQRLALFVGSYELPQTIYKGLVPHLEKAGIEVVTKQEFELGTKDFTAQLVTAARAKPDSAIFLAYYTDTALALKQSREKGLRNIEIAVDPSSINDAVPVLSGPAAEGIRSVWLFPYYTTANDRQVVEFRQKWVSAFGEPPVGRPNYVDLVGYGDAFVLATALKAAGENLTWNGIISAWETVKSASPSTFAPYGTDVIFPESFSPDNHTGNLNFSVVEVKDAAWGVKK